jgi:hypothetical protein
MVKEYCHRARRPEKLRHAYLVGVADPTEEIIAGFLFVNGLKNNNNIHPLSDKVFITRYPCLEASDANILPLLVAKPCRTSQSNWEWLQELPFGAVVFGNPNTKGKTTLPETIASGELDGDVYSICWSKTVVRYIEATNKNLSVHVFNCSIRGDCGDELWVFANTFMGKRRSYEERQLLLKKLRARSAAAPYVEDNGTEPAVDHLLELLIESETVVTQYPSYEKKQFKQIIGHGVIRKKVKLLVQWDSGTGCKVEMFEPLEMLLDAFPDNVVVLKNPIHSIVMNGSGTGSKMTQFDDRVRQFWPCCDHRPYQLTNRSTVAEASVVQTRTFRWF